MDLESVCRLCLKNCGTLKSIFEVVRVIDTISVSCLEMIIYLDFFEVKNDDGFPANVCPKCISKLKSSYAFKKQCENSYRKLLQYSNDIKQPFVKIEVADILSENETNNFDSFNDEFNLGKAEMDFDYSIENPIIDSKLDIELKIDENYIKCDDEKQSVNAQDNSLKAPKCISAVSKKVNRKINDVKHIQDRLGVDIRTLLNEKGNFQCNQCSQIIMHKRMFVRHLEQHLGIKCEFCEICQKHFSYKRIHVCNHLISLEKMHKCDQCDKIFRLKGSLLHHLKSHSDERPHVCNICGKTFKVLERLRTHQKIHSNKEFLCQHCSKAFANKKNLNTHVLFMHSTEKKYKCSKCDKKFSTGHCRNKHELRHLGTKNFQCEICNKTFTMKTSLKTHELSHTNLRPYECRICFVKFKRSDHRNRHEKTAHGFSSKTQNFM